MSQLGQKIRYKVQGGYQLMEPYELWIPIEPSADAVENNGYITLSPLGYLYIAKGYAWDGPSGPTVDTKNFMRASLVHDALHQLMRQSKLSWMHLKEADILLSEMCKEDGMSRIRAYWVYLGVRSAARKLAKTKTRPILEAP